MASNLLGFLRRIFSKNDGEAKVGERNKFEQQQEKEEEKKVAVEIINRCEEMREEEEVVKSSVLTTEIEEGIREIRWIKHYCSGHTILIVGDGDFSFSASLANAFGSASNMIATSLDSLEFLRANYRKAIPNIENLTKRGCKVLHGVDATKMEKHPQLNFTKFDRIIFNFPYADLILKTESRELQLRRHRRLVSRFLISAKEMISERGEIHITHKTNGFHSEWNIQQLASCNGLKLIEAVTFSVNDYEGYKPKFGYGGDANFMCDPSETYMFGLGINASNKENMKKKEEERDKVPSSKHVEIIVRWNKPPVGWVKLNVDGCFKGGNMGGGGGLLRDCNGEFIFGFHASFNVSSAIHAELYALRDGLTLCKQWGFDKVEVEMDSMPAIQLVQRGFNGSREIVYTILEIWILLWGLNHTLSHVYREGNQAADLLANKGVHSAGLVCFNTPFSVEGLVRWIQSDISLTPYLRSHGRNTYSSSVPIMNSIGNTSDEKKINNEKMMKKKGEEDSKLEHVVSNSCNAYDKNRNNEKMKKKIEEEKDSTLGDVMSNIGNASDNSKLQDVMSGSCNASDNKKKHKEKMKKKKEEEKDLKLHDVASSSCDALDKNKKNNENIKKKKKKEEEKDSKLQYVVSSSCNTSSDKKAINNDKMKMGEEEDSKLQDTMRNSCNASDKEKMKKKKKKKEEERHSKLKDVVTSSCNVSKRNKRKFKKNKASISGNASEKKEKDNEKMIKKKEEDKSSNLQDVVSNNCNASKRNNLKLKEYKVSISATASDKEGEKKKMIKKKEEEKGSKLQDNSLNASDKKRNNEEMKKKLHSLGSPAGLKKLDEYLLTRSYITGYQASKDDTTVYYAVAKPPSPEYVNASRWYKHIDALLRISGVTAQGSGVLIDKASAADDYDDDVDLFGEEIEEEKKAVAAVKASSTKKESGKSSVLVDVSSSCSVPGLTKKKRNRVRRKKTLEGQDSKVQTPGSSSKH